MSESTHLETIRRYYDGCNRGDIDQMMSTFTSDVVHYFVEDSPVRGARELADLWAWFNQEGRVARWTVDHEIEQGDEAVIEWTLVWTRPTRSPPTIIQRGAEWYFFRDRKIAEIRAYDLAPGDHQWELNGFPYAAKGYPMLP
jgi:ketosteroid isomerase-like protein